MQDTSPTQRCSHCDAITNNWLWRLVEPQPSSYTILCLPCAAGQLAMFTPEDAIHQAQEIIWFEQRVLTGRVVRSGGAE